MSTSKTRDPILTQVIGHLHTTPLTIRQISHKSGVSEQTIRNWLQGKTRHPQAVTMCFVLRAMGFDLVIRPIARNASTQDPTATATATATQATPRNHPTVQ